MRWKRGPRKRLPSIGRPIEAARRALKLTKVEVQKALGIGVRSIRSWELGTSRPSRKNLKRYIAHIEMLDAKVGAKLRFAITGQALPLPPQPSLDPIIAAVSETADDLGTTPRRVRVALVRLLGLVAAQGFTAQGASVALAEWNAKADRDAAARAAGSQ